MATDEESVEPLEDLTFDLGNLSATSTGDIDAKEYRKRGEAYLTQRAQEQAEKLVHRLFDCPDAGRPPKDGGRLVSLPDTVTALPREKPVPVKAPQTKWEKFAEKKGIVKKKRSRMVFDEESQEYKPRYGYKSVDKDGIESRGIIPHKPGLNLEDGSDPWTQARAEKQERVAKNKRQEMANKRRQMKDSVSTMGATVVELSQGVKEKSKVQLEAAYDIARTSTASVGKFDETRKGEPRIRTGKRQFDAVVAPKPKKSKKETVSGASENSEKANSLRLLGRMLGKEGDINTSKAIKSVHDDVGRDVAQKKRLDRRAEREARKIAKKKEAKKKKKK